MSADRSDDDPNLARGERFFVNHLSVNFSISEVELNFTQQGGAIVEDTARCALTTTPVHLVSFSKTIAQTVASYEQRYGRIPETVASDLADTRH